VRTLERIAVALERIADTNDELVKVMAAVGHSNAMLIRAIVDQAGEEESPPGFQPPKGMDD